MSGRCSYLRGALPGRAAILSTYAGWIPLLMHLEFFNPGKASMRQIKSLILVCGLLAGTLLGQQPIGQINVSWPNLTGSGSPTLDACLHYPALVGGPNAPMAPPPSASGYPVVVFLHGYDKLGSDYAAIGNSLAESGYVAVMLNTAQWSFQQLLADTRATYAAIADLAANPNGPLSSKLDIDRVGLLGHSMGGAVVALVLDSSENAAVPNPGYKCGLCLSPVDPSLLQAGITVNVPIGIVSGQGDMLTPPALHATPYYNAVTPVEGLKFHYEMGLNCTHLNICGLKRLNPSVFARTRKIINGFFGQFLQGSLFGLEAILGMEGQGDPNLHELSVDTTVPQAWASAPLCIGTITRVSVALEGGWGGVLAADSIGAPTATVVGTLLLDHASCFRLDEGPVAGERFDVDIAVPPTSSLIGISFAVQGAGSTVNSQLTLGSALGFTIVL